MTLEAFANSSGILVFLATLIVLGIELLKRLGWLRPEHAKHAAWTVGALLAYLGSVLMAIGRDTTPNLFDEQALVNALIGALAGIGAVGEYEVLLKAILTRLFGAFMPILARPPTAERWHAEDGDGA